MLCHHFPCGLLLRQSSQPQSCQFSQSSSFTLSLRPFLFYRRWNVTYLTTYAHSFLPKDGMDQDLVPSNLYCATYLALYQDMRTNTSSTCNRYPLDVYQIQNLYLYLCLWYRYLGSVLALILPFHYQWIKIQQIMIYKNAKKTPCLCFVILFPGC